MSLQDGAELRDYHARVATGDDRVEWWSKATDAWPDYDNYQANTDRQLPIVILDPVS